MTFFKTLIREDLCKNALKNVTKTCYHIFFIKASQTMNSQIASFYSDSARDYIEFNILFNVLYIEDIGPFENQAKQKYKRKSSKKKSARVK